MTDRIKITELESEKKASGITYPVPAAYAAILLSLVSLFFGVGYLGFGGSIMGAIGLLISIREKSGGRALTLNVVALILGLTAFVLTTRSRTPIH